jgi:hypothetical protein
LIESKRIETCEKSHKTKAHAMKRIKPMFQKGPHHLLSKGTFLKFPEIEALRKPEQIVSSGPPNKRATSKGRRIFKIEKSTFSFP